MADTTVRVAFVGDTKDFRRAADQVASSAKNLEGRFGKLQKSFGSFTKLAAGGFALKQVYDGFQSVTKAAADENQEIAKLNRVLKNAGVPKSVIDSTDEWVTSMQNATAVADTDLRQALSTLVSSGMDVEEAQRTLKTALDLSTARGLKLQTVVTGLGKAYNGNVGALSRYGVKTKDAAGATKTFDQVVQDLNNTFGGSTAAAADTAAGRFEIMRLRIEDLKERIGNALLPVLQDFVAWASTTLVPFIETKLVPAFERFAEWVRQQLPKVKAFFIDVFEGGKKLFEDMAAAFKTNEKTILAVLAGIGAALVALAVAWNAGPGIIITGLVVLAALFLWAYNRSEEFRLGVQVGFTVLARVVEIQVQIIKTALVTLKAVWDALVDAFEFGWDAITGAFEAGMKILRPIFEFLEKMWSLLGNVSDALGKLPGGFPIPLPGGGSVTIPNVSAGNYSGGGNNGVTVNVNGDVYDSDRFSDKVTDAIARARRRGTVV